MGRKVAVLARSGEPRTMLPPPEPRPELPEELDELPEDSLAESAVEAEVDELDEVPALTDNVGEQSVEINVEGLIAELEAESRHTTPPDMISARRKLDDYLERKRVACDLEDFEDFEVE